MLQPFLSTPPYHESIEKEENEKNFKNREICNQNINLQLQTRRKEPIRDAPHTMEASCSARSQHRWDVGG